MVQQQGLSSCTRDLATRQASNNYCLAVSHTKHILDPSPRPPHFFHCLGDVERILPFLLLLWGFPGSSVGKESTCNADPGSIAGSGRSPGEGIGYPLQYSWASLMAQLVKNPPAMWKTWVRFLGWEDTLEKGKATHCSILAWRISCCILQWSLEELFVKPPMDGYFIMN